MLGSRLRLRLAAAFCPIAGPQVRTPHLTHTLNSSNQMLWTQVPNHLRVKVYNTTTSGNCRLCNLIARVNDFINIEHRKSNVSCFLNLCSLAVPSGLGTGTDRLHTLRKTAKSCISGVSYYVLSILIMSFTLAIKSQKRRFPAP